MFTGELGVCRLAYITLMLYFFLGIISVLTLIPVEVDFIATGTFVVRGFDTMLWNDSNFENQYKMSPTGILKN